MNNKLIFVIRFLYAASKMLESEETFRLGVGDVGDKATHVFDIVLVK